MEDLDPDLFPEGDLPRKHPRGKHPRRNKLSAEEALERRRKTAREAARRYYAANLAKGLTANDKQRKHPLNDGLSEATRYARLAKAVSQEEYARIKEETRVLTRTHVSSISDSEAHEKMALNSLVKQEGGYLLRHGFEGLGDGCWMRRRHKGGTR